MADEKKETIIEIAKERFDLCAEMYREERKHALEDIKFTVGEQWPDDIRNARASEGRPCLTINRLPQFVRQIVNDIRQNRPSVKVIPVDDKADIETADVLKGIIRHIEYNSNADIAYDRAVNYAVRGGFGFYRVCTDYLSPTSFDQEILIKSVENPFNCYLGPHCEPDGSDADYGFIFEDIPKDQFKKMYPKHEEIGLDNWRSEGDSAMNWVTENTVRVAEYFYKETKTVKLYQLEDGSVMLESQLKDGEMPPFPIVNERETQVPVIHHCKMTGMEELEKTSWPGIYIPIIPVYGDEINVDGKRIHEGIARHAKDPQRMLNYWASAETETITLSPKAPWIGVEGQFEGHEAKWAQANRKNFAYLEYKPKSIGGQPVGPPQRNSFEPPVMAITQARMQTGQDLKDTTGIYDAGLGNQSNETSGIAIQRRNTQSQTSNFHFVDNLSRSQRHLGRILVDLIPKVYDTERAITILGEDEEEKLVYINQVFEDETDGKEKLFNLGYGKYDVTVSTGPSYQTKRQEAADALIQLSGQNPQIAQFAGDLLMKSLDIPMADELAERLKRTIPPEILGEEGMKDIPPQMQAQMNQAQQMIDQLTQQLNEQADVIEKEKTKYEFELEKAKLDHEAKLAKIEADMRIALLKEGAADNREAFRQEIAQIDRRQKELQDFEKEVNQYNQNPTGGPMPGN